MQTQPHACCLHPYGMCMVICPHCCSVFAEPKSSPDNAHVAANCAARDKRKRQCGGDNDDSPPGEQTQPALAPRMTNREKHGSQFLRDTMQQMVSLNETSEHAAAQRAQEREQQQYERMVYKGKMQQYALLCQQQAQRNSAITAQNGQLLEIWKVTKGDPPKLQGLDTSTVPLPTPPKDPAVRRAEAAAARKAEVEAEAALKAAAEKAEADRLAAATK